MWIALVDAEIFFLFLSTLKLPINTIAQISERKRVSLLPPVLKNDRFLADAVFNVFVGISRRKGTNEARTHEVIGVRSVAGPLKCSFGVA